MLETSQENFKKNLRKSEELTQNLSMVTGCLRTLWT